MIKFLCAGILFCMETPKIESGNETVRIELFLNLLRKKVKLLEDELLDLDQGVVSREKFHLIKERRSIEAFLQNLISTINFIEDARMHGNEDCAKEMENILALYSQI